MSYLVFIKTIFSTHVAVCEKHVDQSHEQARWLKQTDQNKEAKTLQRTDLRLV